MKNTTENEKKIQDWYNQFYQEIYKLTGRKTPNQRIVNQAQKDKMYLHYSPEEAAEFLTM